MRLVTFQPPSHRCARRHSSNEIREANRPFQTRSSQEAMSQLKERIHSRQARVVVVGAGYVGLPLAVETASAGFHTVAFDKNGDKVRAVNEGASYIKDIPDSALGPLVRS